MTGAIAEPIVSSASYIGAECIESEREPLPTRRWTCAACASTLRLQRVPAGVGLAAVALAVVVITLGLVTLVPPPKPLLKLRWADEFNGASLDTDSWRYQLGDGSLYGLGGWGNGELQCYTNSSANTAIVRDADDPSGANGLLAIVATYQAGRACDNGQAPASSRDWTSARLVTWGTRSFMPRMGLGLKVEARVKVPMDQGTWPAFWMLPDPSTTPYGSWCASGEIDVVEHVNSDTRFYGTVHYGGGVDGVASAGCTSSKGVVDTNSPSDWHTHAVVWTPQYIAWLLDDREYYRSTMDQWYSGNAPGMRGPPFDKPFYLLLNLAVGGAWPGDPASNGPFTYLVDWVRVWDVQLLGYDSSRWKVGTSRLL